MQLTDKQFGKFELIVLACTTVSDYNSYSFHCTVLLCVGLEWYKRTLHKYTCGRLENYKDIGTMKRISTKTEAVLSAIRNCNNISFDDLKKVTGKHLQNR